MEDKLDIECVWENHNDFELKILYRSLSRMQWKKDMLPKGANTTKFDNYIEKKKKEIEELIAKIDEK